MVDLSTRLVVFVTGKPGSPNEELCPFVLMLEGRDDDPEDKILVPCWLELHEGNGFDPELARASRPEIPENNKLALYRLLQKMDVTINGKKRQTYRAVCDRSRKGDVGYVTCDEGTLWTILPES